MSQSPPYVVSGDIDILVKRWAARHKFKPPMESFFCGLRRDFENALRSVFENVDYVPSDELANPSVEGVERGKCALVTLDKTYVLSEHSIETTRTVLPDLSDGPVAPRQNNPGVETQIKTLRQKLGGVEDVIVYDDVIFTGHLLLEACEKLQAAGLKIKSVVCGVGIRNGIDRINRHGLHVRSKREYAEVVDQVCERDFYPGVDYCGRTLSVDRFVGFPYLLPFGKPGPWASIPPEHAVNFSRFCIGESIRLFREIESASGRPILCSDIDRKMVDLPQNGARFIDYLAQKEREII